MLQDFNKSEPEIEGVVTAKRIATDAGAASAKVITPTSIVRAASVSQSLHLSVEHGVITANFSAAVAGRASVALMNSLGQVITSKNVNATRGANSVSLETSYQGAAFLVIRQGSQKMVKSVRLK